MADNGLMIAEKMVDRLYDEYGLEFPIMDPRELVPKLGGDYEATSDYKIHGADAAVVKHKHGFTIAVCEPGQQYDIDIFQKAQTDYLVCRTIGQLVLYMGYSVNPKKWNTYMNGIYPYKDIRYAKYRSQLDYFGHAMMLPKRIFTNSMIHHTKTGYEHGVDIRGMAADLQTTPQRVVERGKQLGYYLRDISRYG